MGNTCIGRSNLVNHYHTPSSTSPGFPNSKIGGGGGGNDVVHQIDPNVHSSSSSNNNTAETSSLGDDNNNKTTTVITGPCCRSLKIFKLVDLKSATRNFRPDTVLGEGGFGTVYKGWIDQKTFAPSKPGVGMPVAVKRSNQDSSQGLEEWQAEVKFLGKFEHSNLVKLLGYCLDDNQFLLVYECMQKGSLESHLFRKGAEALSWEIRLKIAIGAAQGLAFLHSSEKSVIYRDFKASNILLDRDFNTKLSDFGLAKFGPINGKSHVTTRIMGTHGYAAPEYVATGHLYIKSDVYGFGVVLLEILTGLRAIDTNRPSGEYRLVEWAITSLSNKKKLKKIMDPRLQDQYPVNAALESAQLILQCLEADPKSRPSMEEVLQTLRKISKIKHNSKERKSDDSARRNINDTHSENHYQHKSPRSGNGHRTYPSSR